jgi:hypothetical protein
MLGWLSEIRRETKNVSLALNIVLAAELITEPYVGAAAVHDFLRAP